MTLSDTTIVGDLNVDDNIICSDEHVITVNNGNVNIGNTSDTNTVINSKDEILLNGKRIALTEDNYGTSAPTTAGVEGQIYFVLID